MGVIDEHLRTDVLPGDGSPTSGKPGPADDMLASNIKVNAIGDLVSTGRLSPDELSATIAGQVEDAINEGAFPLGAPALLRDASDGVPYFSTTASYSTVAVLLDPADATPYVTTGVLA